MSSSDTETVDFFFDPMCPWAYQGSLWIREVRRQRPLDITWRFFSLETINREEGKKFPWERPWSYGWSQMRIGALLRREGQDHVDRWYQAVGKAFFEDAVPTQDRERHAGILADLGYPPDTIDRAITDPTTHDEVRADHEFIVGQHGAFGVPTLLFPGAPAVHGPVVVPAPRGEEAVRLWDHTKQFVTFGSLFELKRCKSNGDRREIASRFEPYLQARTWRTIEHAAP